MHASPQSRILCMGAILVIIHQLCFLLLLEVTVSLSADNGSHEMLTMLLRASHTSSWVLYCIQEFGLLEAEQRHVQAAPSFCQVGHRER